MKRWVKIVLAIGLALLVIGGALVGVAVWRGHGFSGVSNITHREQNEVFVADRVSSLVIDADNDEVVLLPSEDGQISVTFDTTYQGEKLLTYYDITLLDGTLTIRQRMEAGLWFSVDFGIGETPLTVRVPQALLTQLDVVTSNGKITAEELQIGGSATFRSDNGRITLRGLTIGDTLGLETDNGTMELENLRVGGDFTAESRNGKTILRSTLLDGSADLHASNGEISLTDCTVEGLLRASLNNGALEASRTALAGCDIDSDNGAVRLALVGSEDDYFLDLSTSNGSVTAPAGNRFAEQTLRIRTKNGSITVEFSQPAQ